MPYIHIAIAIRSGWFGFFGSSGSGSASTSPQKSGQHPTTTTKADDLEAGGAGGSEDLLGQSPSSRKSRASGVNDSTSSECSTTDEFMAQLAGQKAKTYKKTLRLSTDLIVSVFGTHTHISI